MNSVGAIFRKNFARSLMATLSKKIWTISLGDWISCRVHETRPRRLAPRKGTPVGVLKCIVIGWTVLTDSVENISIFGAISSSFDIVLMRAHTKLSGSLKFLVPKLSIYVFFCSIENLIELKKINLRIAVFHSPKYAQSHPKAMISVGLDSQIWTWSGFVEGLVASLSFCTNSCWEISAHV